MFDELYDTYGIEDGDGMYLPEENRVRFWGK
jgi:predicted metalloendopeptidase